MKTNKPRWFTVIWTWFYYWPFKIIMYAGFIVRVCRDFDKNDVREKKNLGQYLTVIKINEMFLCWVFVLCIKQTRVGKISFFSDAWAKKRIKLYYTYFYFLLGRYLSGHINVREKHQPMFTDGQSLSFIW